MPPRIQLLPRLGSHPLCLRPAVKVPSPSPLPLTMVANITAKALRQKYRDPYARAQALQRKAVNLQRREELKIERQEAFGDPVRGVSTPFLESFDDATAPHILGPKVFDGGDTEVEVTDETPLNHFLKPSEVRKALQDSFILTQPAMATNPDLQDPAQEAEEIKRHAEAHDRATAAVARIISLANGSQKDRTRANIQRCVETFGRHNTDKILRPRALANHSPEEITSAAKTPRAGPDTGSSEVQVAILTAKIRVLANQLEQGGKNDKMNKRNLRLLVHRRQKLLAYLRRKERGGERWQRVIETLGLTDATWRGEISL